MAQLAALSSFVLRSCIKLQKVCPEGYMRLDEATQGCIGLLEHSNYRWFGRLNHVNRLPVYPASTNHSTKFSHVYLNKEKKILGPSMLLYYLAAILKGFHSRSDDDFVDKLNYHYTSTLIFTFAIVVSAKQYVGYPIQCWVPAQFTDAWEQYTENYCWVQNTYYLPISRALPNFGEREIQGRQIGYYQWVPFVLAIEAFMFYIPCFLWRGMTSWYSGINVNGITQMAVDTRLMDADSRASTAQTIAGHIQDSLEIQKDIGTHGVCLQCLMCRHHCNGYVTSLYVVVKALYGLNAMAQVFLLNGFLGTHNWYYGFTILMDLFRGREWMESGNFPRVTLCDFEVRVLGNVHHHTVQCVLMINLFNEKIFLFLWFWYLLITVVTVSSFAHWLLITGFPGQKERFVKRYLKASNLIIERASVHKFVSKFLGPDGVFCLRMISLHAGDIIATQVVVVLWTDYYNRGRRSPIEVYDNTASVNSPSMRLHELNFKQWLMGQSYPGLDASRGNPGHKRRKSDTYLSFA